MSLTEQLEEFSAQGRARMPEEVRTAFDAAIDGLRQAGLGSQALGVGDTVPDFELPNHKGETVRLSDLLADGPLVVSFYRGGWCPYCNFELKALQEKLPEITDLGARLVAVTPELPDNAMTTAEKNAISFDVLSDLGNKVADAFGLVFTLPEPLQPIYRNFGLDLAAINGEDSLTLPVPATYVVDTDRKVLSAYVEVDYSKRLEPSEVVKALQARG